MNDFSEPAEPLINEKCGCNYDWYDLLQRYYYQIQITVAYCNRNWLKSSINWPTIVDFLKFISQEQKILKINKHILSTVYICYCDYL